MATNASAFICAFTRKGGRGSTRTHQHYFREKMNKLSQTHIEMFNRRPTQICADSIFSLADLARKNLHALRANRFLQKSHYPAEPKVRVRLRISAAN
jgi:hypothetical protein